MQFLWPSFCQTRFSCYGCETRSREYFWFVSSIFSSRKPTKIQHLPSQISNCAFWNRNCDWMIATKDARFSCLMVCLIYFLFIINCLKINLAERISKRTCKYCVDMCRNFFLSWHTPSRRRGLSCFCLSELCLFLDLLQLHEKPADLSRSGLW